MRSAVHPRAGAYCPATQVEPALPDLRDRGSTAAAMPELGVANVIME